MFDAAATRLSAGHQRLMLHTRRVLLRCIARTQRKERLVRIGTPYGGWWVPTDEIVPGSVCCCAGVGEDISFDLALVEQLGCRVVAMDPTPRAVAYVDNLCLPPGLVFLPLGLGGTARTERFYAPKDPRHVSHSISNLQRTTDYFEAPLVTLSDVMAQSGVERFDLLKIDIEGAEHEVIEAIERTGPVPRVLLVEFDQPEPIGRSRRTLSRLRRIGYQVVKVERFNVTLVRPTNAPRPSGRRDVA